MFRRMAPLGNSLYGKISPDSNGSDYKILGKYPIVSQEEGLISGYWDNEEDVCRIKHPIVAFGDHTRIIKYIDFDFVIGADGLKVLSPIKEIVPKFLFYFLRWCNIPSLGYSRHYKLLKELMIPIPSIEEQERIVTELDLLTGIIDKQKQQLKELDNLAQSIFYDMFKEELTSLATKRLKDIASYRIGLTYKPTDVADKGVIVLRSSNIQSNRLDFKDVVRVNLAVDSKKLVSDGDILMCARNGSAKLVGKVARIRDIDEEMSFGAFMTTITSQYNDYLFHFFLSPFFRSQLGSAQTATINQITSKMLDEIKLNVPSLEKLSIFAKKIQSIELQKASINRSIEESQKLFDYTMDKYFG